MEGIRSPLFLAIQKILELFGVEQHVSCYSYQSDFERLWEISEFTARLSGRIWCVIDDLEQPMKWLPIGIWGRYYRSKNGSRAPKIILIGNDTALNPPPQRGKIYVPDFYEDEGLIKIPSGSLQENFVVELYRAIQTLKTQQAIVEESEDEEKSANEFNPTKQQIMAWKGLMYAALTSPGYRHAVSNEIAPLLLRDAIVSLRDEVDDRVRFVTKLEERLKLDNERKALLRFWEWISEFQPDSCPGGYKEDKIKPSMLFAMKDIWEVWSKAHYLLLDDQAKSHGYVEIVRTVLELMIGDDVRLEAAQSYIHVDEIIDRYDCLFLDLRLEEADATDRNYKTISGVRLARQISKQDPSFPIIIFSSSQQREVDILFADYKNIITCFRKPGVVGSAESASGNKALKDLLSAVRQAFQMLENRIVYKKSEEVDGTDTIIKYTTWEGRPRRLSVKISKDMMLKLFGQVFMERRYDKAFDFPYSYFEEIFDRYDLSRELKFISQVGLVAKTDGIKIENGRLSEKAKCFEEGRRVRSTRILARENVKLRDLELEQWSPDNLNLNIQSLHQFRNIASHGIRNFNEMRRVAIVILLIFLDVLGGKASYESYDSLGDVTLKKLNEFPLIHACPDMELKNYISLLLATICYYGNLSVRNRIYCLLENDYPEIHNR